MQCEYILFIVEIGMKTSLLVKFKKGTQLIQLKIVKWSPFKLNVQFRVTI